jgi:serine/threonine protein kinase/formylglycine-generating enzyme required for sulfatase activity
MPKQDEIIFGQIAVSEGHITTEQLEECLTLQSESGGHKTLWEIVVEKSYIDRHITNQLLEKIDHRKSISKTRNKIESYFGDIAASKRFCTREQIDQAIAEQKKRMQSGRNQRLGELCVELGILTPEQVALILNEQNRSIVVCEGCGSAYNVEGFPAGKRWRCKVCNAMLEVSGAPAFASLPIDQLLSEQIEEAAKEEPGPAPVKAKKPPARTEKTKFGNYYIIEKIARGGMGIIYKARQRGLDRIVALKVLIAGESASEETIKRFYLEAKSVAKLRHPNIVPIHEVGIHEGKHFFAMDFIHGENLRHIILNQKINVHWALELTAKVANALHYAHEHNLVHRDIKPENILLDETGEPQITDFGLAKDVDTDVNLTRAGLVMGTPAYMSPEQARGGRAGVDRRTDNYSLGVVLYEMLTGKQVFEFEGPIGLNMLIKTISQDPVPPRKINPRIPREVETIVMKSLEKEPERRYQTAEEFSGDIERYLTGEPILAKPPSFTYRTWKKIKKYKVASISMLSALAAIVVVAVYFINKQIEDNRRIESQVKTDLADASKKLARGEFMNAKDLYIKAAALRPGNQEAARGLLKVEFSLTEKEKLRQQEEARNRAELATTEGNNLLEKARELLAEDKRLDSKKKYLEAMREFDRAMANDHNNEGAKNGKFTTAVELGQLNMEDKDFGVAMLMFSFAEGLGVNDKKSKELVEAAQKARLKAEKFEELLIKANKAIADGFWSEAFRNLELAKEFEGISEDEKIGIEERIKEVRYSQYFTEGEEERKKGNASAAIKAFLKAESFQQTPEVKERLKSVLYDRAVRKGNDHLAREEFAEALKAYLDAKQYASNTAEITELLEKCRDRGFNHYLGEAITVTTLREWKQAAELLKKALSFRPENQRARKLKSEVAAAASCPENMIYMFSGKLSAGSTVLDDRNPPREVFVDFFYIDMFEVTNTEYKAFVDAGGYQEEKFWDTEGFEQIKVFTDRTGKPGPATWESSTFPLGKEDFPVTGISWYEAQAYARWAGKRLPTEEEWEKAASYNPENDNKFTYPWGDQWNADYGNFRDDEVTKFGSFPNDVSPAGCFDMGGNAFEWTASSYKEKYRVIRGGSVGLSESTLKRFARTTKRKCPKPSYRSKNTGFRCALTSEK